MRYDGDAAAKAGDDFDDDDNGDTNNFATSKMKEGLSDRQRL
jgi:hypothetical protein